jgi:cell wall-associated NlpC family hydrolase
MQSLDSATAVAVTDPTTAGLRRVALSSITGAAVLAGIVATQTAPAVNAYKTITKAESPMTEAQAAVAAASDVTLTSDTVKVSTEAAPVVVAPKPEPVAQPVAQAKTQVAVESAPAQAPAAPAAAAPAVPAANSDRAGAIVAAAYAQLGQTQDCTMLVTRSLAAVGINFHGWPADYYSLGTPVSADAALPGDLIFYANGGYGGVPHIAIYIGDGKAIHGGWNGSQTVIFSANVGSGPAFIRLR